MIQWVPFWVVLSILALLPYVFNQHLYMDIQVYMQLIVLSYHCMVNTTLFTSSQQLLNMCLSTSLNYSEQILF